MTRYAATLAAGVALGLGAGRLLRSDEETQSAARTAPEASPRAARSAPSGNAHAPRRRAEERDAAAPPSPRSAAAPRSRAAADSPRTPEDARAAAPSSQPATAGEASGDVARAAVSPSPAATPDPAAPAAESAPPAREATGVVVDAATQQPVGGARVLLAIASGPRAGAWWGGTTGDDGRFHDRVDDATNLAGARMEVRVLKDGYEPARVAAADGDLRVELRPRTTPPVPGRVVGLARSADGRPFAGEIAVDGSDADGGNATQWTIADASGTFVLEGVPPGAWRLALGRGPGVEVLVPEGGEARVELTAADGRGGDGRTVTDVDPSQVRVEGARAQEALRELLRLSSEVADSKSLDAGAKERLARQVAQEVQRLEEGALAATPRREIAITGLPADARVWVRLELRPRHFRRTQAQGGVARFADVPAGRYQAVLVEPGRAERTMPVVVGPGEGRFEVAFR